MKTIAATARRANSFAAVDAALNHTSTKTRNLAEGIVALMHAVDVAAVDNLHGEILLHFLADSLATGDVETLLNAWVDREIPVIPDDVLQRAGRIAEENPPIALSSRRGYNRPIHDETNESPTCDCSHCMHLPDHPYQQAARHLASPPRPISDEEQKLWDEICDGFATDEAPSTHVH